MANWANPTITSNYVTFVDEVKARDFDAISLQAVAVTNPPSSSIRLLRSPIKFQEWGGTQWYNLVLSPEGGGTGLTSLTALAGQLGLGSMAFQNSNAINVTGGSLSSISVVNIAIGGNGQYQGTGFQFLSYQDNTPILVTGGKGNWAILVNSPNVAGQSNGMVLTAGTSKTDTALFVRNAAANLYGFHVRGDMCVSASIGFAIPVGANKYIPT